MDRRECIPTLHELNLAGRIERAKVIFGPGGYLPTARYEIGSHDPEEGFMPRKNIQVSKISRGVADQSRQQERNKRRQDVGEMQDLEHTRSQALCDGGSSATNGQDDVCNSNESGQASSPKYQGHTKPVSKPLQTKAVGGPSTAALSEERRVMTTITLTIVGGRSGGQGFTNLQQKGKVWLVQVLVFTSKT